MRVLCILMFMVLALSCYGQQTNPHSKFGQISVNDLKRKIYPVDSSADAVVLCDVGQASIEGNLKGWFSLSLVRHRVVHILNKNGYEEADVEIYLHTDGDAEEKLDFVRAVTYNLENGKIVESKLDKSSVFKDYSGKRNVQKFTFPNVKEGSIIEYEYRISSDYIQNIDPWIFQGALPVLWSEYNLSVPQFFTYVSVRYGPLDFFIADKKDRVSVFSVTVPKGTGPSENVRFTSGITDYRWVIRNVPAIHEESYTSSLKNHISRIEFQLASQSEPLEVREYTNSWRGLTSDLLKFDSFGNALSNSNYWLENELDPVIKGATSQTEKAQRIYAFIRDNFTCTNHSALFAEQSLKTVLKTKRGNVSEINLLLTAMLRYAGLQSDPVILSTRDNGYALKEYPVLTNFNYVIIRCTVEGKSFFLDATHPHLGFGRLLPGCYNGHARIVNDSADAVFFYPDSLNEKKFTALFIHNTNEGKRVGNMRQSLGLYESYEIRDQIQQKGMKDFFEEVEEGWNNSIEMVSSGVDSLNNYEEPITLKYEILFKPDKDEIVYVNPMFGEAMKRNPFEPAKRFYPVEMPYTLDETYLLTMEVPKGYVVDVLPKQLVAKLDERGSAFFEYRISQSGATISLRSRLKISRTSFANDEYANLRQFFDLIVSKQNEQIVFKKKN